MHNIAFEKFPTLETNRFNLRKLKISDAPQIFDYFSNEEVTKYYDVETFETEQQALDLINRLLVRYEAGKQIRWAIALKDTDLLIGTIGFHSIEPEHYKVEIGYELHPDYWGKGIMSEVIEKVVDFAFRGMNYNRIEAFYHPENIASHKVLIKNGFEYEGLLKKRFFVKEKFIDAALAAIVKENGRRV